MPVLGPGAAASTPAALSDVYLPAGEVPVIGLHQEDPTTVLRIIKRRGFNPIWASELAAALDGTGSLPPQPVMLVFDDGDPLWYTRTHPAMVQYGIKAVMAVTSDYLYGRTTALAGAGITWDQARQMHATGLYDWQNHSQTHPAKPSNSEMLACNQAISEELDVPEPVAMIYPYGSYDADMITRARDLGFTLGFKFSSQDDPRPTFFPGHGLLTVNRTMDLADPVKWARQSVIYNYEHDMTSGRNAANTLGYWTLSGPEVTLAESGRVIQINSTAATGALSAITTDYFHVVDRTLYSHCRVDTTGHTVGIARVSIRQYDAARVELARLDLASYTATQTTVILASDVNLDTNCRFVRLEVASDAAFDGTLNVREWIVRVR